MIQLKNILLLSLLTFSLTVSAQLQTYVGTYKMSYEFKKGGLVEYTLSLKPNGTFLFHSYRNIDPSQPNENKYAKGAWEVEKEKVLYFYADKEVDLDETHTLNFNNSKARYNSKSTRDKSDRIIRKSLKFYDSDIFWVKGMKLYKKE